MEHLGALNFRDLGGIRVAEGRLRSGLVYRSEGPASFDERHHAELKALGIRLICDLRSAGEHRHAPHLWADGIRQLNFDVAADLRDRDNPGWARLRAEPSAANAREAMLINYRAMPAAFRPHLGVLADAMLAGETPVLIHCSAGKDRTGALVALLLLLCGADRAEVLRDFMVSECFGRDPANCERVRRLFARTVDCPVDDAMLAPIVGVEPAYVAALEEAIAAGWGTVEAYFEDAGVDAAKQAALITLLVAPARQPEPA